MKSLALALLAMQFAIGARASAQTEAPPRMSPIKGGADWFIDVSAFTSKKQRELFESGLTTFSRLEVRKLGANGSLEGEPLVKINCTARYDLWRESFEVIQMLEQPKPSTAKDFEEFGKHCLQVKLEESAVQKDGGSPNGLVATLFVDQVSVERAAKIREWLIKQQSGVMQSVFSHMLGDLKLSERVDVFVQLNHTVSTKVNTK